MNCRVGSLLVLTGSKAALSATSFMLGYGMAKNAVHYLTKCVASDAEAKKKNLKVLTILPYSV